MAAAPVCISLKLRVQVASVEPSDPGRAVTVAGAVHAVTGNARIRRAGVASAQGNQLAGRGEPVRCAPFDRFAGAEAPG